MKKAVAVVEFQTTAVLHLQESDSTNVMAYGKAIRFVRSARGLTQRELAQKTGLDSSFVSLIEAGKREASLATIEKIATGLKVPMHLLVLLASGKGQLRGVSEKQAKVIAKALIDLLDF